ncbi:hypothetical protein QUB05_12290 [Microcoleus sp. F10-C6]
MKQRSHRRRGGLIAFTDTSCKQECKCRPVLQTLSSIGQSILDLRF